ncbi:hypothetical protein GCM10023194_27290 [Planotetraspora phitsanulokensis]|uniref:Uncharacterized protein n=1 Tax=Planotetraspora phitsanulokensis TaxID=575192 RepID=A0A8J3U500_9ACTN|nr:hypothetical protein Pph01_11370 [Planotetraspora phitsanulokensis]
MAGGGEVLRGDAGTRDAVVTQVSRHQSDADEEAAERGDQAGEQAQDPLAGRFSLRALLALATLMLSGAFLLPR